MDEKLVTVLLVDDEKDYLNTLSKRLGLRQLHVLCANSAQEALETLGREAVDIVVLDVKMPGMDGIEAMKIIKERHPLVEVIMLTGHANLEASLEGMEQGAFDYLLKPADVDLLVYKIQDAFEKVRLHKKKIEALKAAVQSQEA